jgi:hypothetical protein
MITQYQLYKQHDIDSHGIPPELKIPDIKSKLNLLQEEQRIFGSTPYEISPIK